ncbi:hypothetical protein GQ600_18322 [Phytophthora cactorum]|nr:hypothetical protein GQ600_18322 [Phytophthora cactorum]
MFTHKFCRNSLLLCSKRSELSSVSHSRRVEDQNPSSELLLAQFQQQLRAEVDAYHSRLYHEMDPATVRVRAQFQHESEQLRQRLKENEDRKRGPNRPGKAEQDGYCVASWRQ